MSKYAESIDESFVQQYKDKVPPWGPVGYVVYKRTYARKVDGENRTEEWWETLRRCCNGIIKIGGKFTQNEIQTLYDKVFNLKCCFSGRALWQLGTSTVDKIGADSLQNCWNLAVTDPIEAFCFAFEELMLGGGVGFNIQREFVYEMPKIKYDITASRRDEKDVDLIVPDNREGWVNLLKRTLEAFYYTGKSFDYSTICIRGKGAAISGFGGTASGPEDLCNGIDQISNILRNRVGKKLRPIDCLDIMNIIGSVVVAGNVRRSALLALGDMDDRQYLDAKNWGKGSIPNWRSMSNNSVVCSDIEHLPAKFWSGYNGEGEPYGLVNLKNCQTYGRIADKKGYRPDRDVTGVNPCSEITLSSYESCNLAEIFLPNIKNEAEFKEVAGLLCKVTKTISCLPFIHEVTNNIVSKNHRLGIGVTGFLQAEHLRKENIFNNVYRHIESIDEKYSELIGVKTSIKLTTTKPSGTLSLLPQVTPGVHPAYSKYYIRRVRMASIDPLVEKCREHGFPVEPVIKFDGTHDHGTMVVSFPIQTPKEAIVAESLTAIDQMEWSLWLQTYWSDNSVSVTVYYRKEELPAIKEWLKNNYNDKIKTISFLLHTDHGFVQAPMEPITKEQYEKMSSKTKPITRIMDTKEMELIDSLECAGGSCPVK